MREYTCTPRVVYLRDLSALVHVRGVCACSVCAFNVRLMCV